MDNQRESIVAERKDQNPKKTYVRPELTKHGAVESLTQQPAPSTSQPNFDPV